MRCVVRGDEPRAAQVADAAAAFREQVAPVLAHYCTGCHGGAKPKGELALDGYKDAQAAEKDRETWERVLEMLDLGEMPPKDKPRPNAGELEQLTTWIRAALAKTDCTGDKQPGQVTLHRLNRAEYNNTIRDLMGIDFH